MSDHQEWIKKEIALLKSKWFGRHIDPVIEDHIEMVMHRAYMKGWNDYHLVVEDLMKKEKR